jgi:tetratricopeptide (TPR) repeat protein
MIGVIQVGNQSLADRYLYLAMLGPIIAVVGSLVDFASRSPSRAAQARRQDARPWHSLAGGPWAWATVAVAMVCLPLTWRQAGVWRDSLTLFSHALATGHESAVARNNLGLALTELGRPGDALPHLRRAVELRGVDAGAWFNLGNACAAVGDLPAGDAAGGAPAGHGAAVAAQLQPPDRITAGEAAFAAAEFQRQAALRHGHRHRPGGRKRNRQGHQHGRRGANVDNSGEPALHSEAVHLY